MIKKGTQTEAEFVANERPIKCVNILYFGRIVVGLLLNVDITRTAHYPDDFHIQWVLEGNHINGVFVSAHIASLWLIWFLANVSAYKLTFCGLF